MMWNSGCHLPCGRRPRHRGIGEEEILELDIVRSCATHPHRVPCVEDRDALGAERDAEMQHARPGFGIVMDRARHQDSVPA